MFQLHASEYIFSCFNFEYIDLMLEKTFFCCPINQFDILVAGVGTSPRFDSLIILDI